MEGRSGADFSRRGLLSAAFAGAAVTAFGVAASRAHASVPRGTARAAGSSSRVRPLVGTGDVPSSWVAKPFPLADVQLAPSLFTANRDRMLGFVGSFPMDRMLYNFRKNDGLDTQGAQPLDSWEDPTSLLRGHFTGHYLSALAQAHAGAGGSTQYKTIIDQAVAALGQCQDALAATSAAGYLAAFPESQFDQLEQYGTYPSVWAPWYTNHKIMAGLLACYELAGSTQALDIVTKMGTWSYNRLAKTTEAQRQKMWDLYIAGEYGGMNESLMRLYELTGQANFLTAAKWFDTTSLLDASTADTDILNGLHANQHIPQFLGYLKVFEDTGDQAYLGAVQNFWGMVVGHRTYAHGGTGQGEIFRARDKVAGTIVTDTNAETCAAYNMLKVSRALFLHDQDPKYMDYYERTLFNQILGSRRASDSATDPLVTYMLPVGPGVRRGFGNFGTCCGGTGMENHTKYQDTIYTAAVDDSALSVNLYIPSTLAWRARDVTVTQVSGLPSTGDVTLTIAGSGRFDLRLRIPSWATDTVTLSVNGTPQTVPTEAGTYAVLSRTWADGDKVQLSLPMHMRVESTVDDGTLQAVMRGPSVLVARSGQSDYRPLSLYPALPLSGNVEGMFEAGQDADTYLTKDGTVWAPLHQGTDDAYHMYFRRKEPTVAFGGVDSRVTNPAKPDRSTLLDDIWSHAPFADRNAFYDTVFATSEQWVADGRLSRRDRQAVLLAAGRARFEG